MRQSEDAFVALRTEKRPGARDQRIDMRLPIAAGRLVRGHAIHQRPDVDGEFSADFTLESRRDLANVFAAIAIRGELELSADAFQVPQPHAQRQDVHLAAGVVDIVFALHVETGRLENVRDARSIGRPPTVPDVERPGRVRGHELHLNAPAAPDCRTCAPHAGLENATHECGECIRRNAEIDEPGSRDRHLGNHVRFGKTLHDARGDFAWLALRDAGERQRDGAREVAVSVAAAALDRNGRQRIEREFPFLAKRGQRALEKRSDVLLHRSDTLRFASKTVVAPERRGGTRGSSGQPTRRKAAHSI